MKAYDKRILSELLDRYENSSLFKGINKRNITISYPIKKDKMPEYFDLTDNTFNDIHAQLEPLESEGLITLVWQKKKQKHILEKVSLNLSHIDEAYRYLKRTPKSCQEYEFLSFLKSYPSKGDTASERFIAYLIQKTENHESVKHYVHIENLPETALLLNVLEQLENNQKERFIREFSIEVFHDSKAFEKNLNRICDIVRKFSSNFGLKTLTNEALMAEFNVYKNPTYVYLKGQGILSFYQNELNLKDLKGGIGIQNEDLEHISFREKPVIKSIFTIENLTTYNRFDYPNSLIIYLGGFHNRTRRALLTKLYNVFPKADYYHFGDIDCGGFKILVDLIQKTGIPFSPFKMDTETLLQYKAYGKPITQNDQKELERLLNDPQFKLYNAVLSAMKEQKYKLEQECILQFS